MKNKFLINQFPYLVIVLIICIFSTYSCKGGTLNNTNDSVYDNYVVDSISGNVRVDSVKRKNVNDYDVDSIKIIVHGESGIDLSAIFRGDSNVVVMRNIFGRYCSILSPLEHNLILESIDSIYISKTSKVVENKIKQKHIAVTADYPFWEISIYKNGKVKNDLNLVGFIIGDTFYLYSNPFFNITNTLYVFNRRNCWEDTEYKGYNSPKDELIKSMERLFAPKPIPEDILKDLEP